MNHAWAEKKEKRYKLKALTTYPIKIIAENFLNLEQQLIIQVQEAFRTPNRQDQKRTSPRYFTEQGKNSESLKGEVSSHI
jgi:hypothetical protein